MKPILPSRQASQIESFSGRTWLLPKVQEWLKTDERFLIIKGLPGTGKSMVMAWLAGAGPLPGDPVARVSLESIRSSVRAAHFCMATSGNTSPRAAAMSLDDQLTRTVRGFSNAIAASLVGLVTIAPNQEHFTVEDGAFNTGVYIEHLDLSGVSDVASFNTLLRGPLQKLYDGGYAETLVIVIDGLDEAYDPNSGSSLPHLLSRVSELDKRVRFLLSSRPDPRVLVLFPGARTIDLIENAPQELDEVRQYVFDSLAFAVPPIPDPQRGQVADSLAKKSGKIFLYANLALGILLKEPARMANPDALVLPDGLAGIYTESLNHELGLNYDRWLKEYRPILGMIGVGLGDGLEKDHIDRFYGDDSQGELVACAQYLTGTLLAGPFQLFHRSFSDYLFEDPTNQLYHIDANKMHLKIAEAFCAGQGCGEAAAGWEDYGLRFAALHLSSAALASKQPTRHQLALRLLNLVTSPSFQEVMQERLRDPHTLKDEIHAAMYTLSQDDDPQVLPQLVEAALRLESFWSQMRLPDGPLKFARQGDLEAAERSLALFDLDSDWRQISLLCLAWLAKDANQAGSQALLERLKPLIAPADNGLIPHLWKRVQASTNNLAQPAPMRYLPSTNDPNIPVEILRRMRGEGHNNSLLGSISGELMFAQSGKTVGPKGYLAEADSPYLVSWAFKHIGEGEDYLDQYIEIHRAYPYVKYRNISLKIILEYVISIPEDSWVLEKLTACVTAGLTGVSIPDPVDLKKEQTPNNRVSGYSTVEFNEGLGLTLSGLAGAADLAAGNPAGPGLAAYQQARLKALQATYNLPNQNGPDGEDRWSHNLQRLSALGVIDARLLNNIPNSQELLMRAQDLPRGFAGFRSPACLTLAEELSLCNAEAGQVLAVVDEARSAAHNIQDATFCALSTARANAMRKNWWEKPLADLPALIDRFAKDPRSAEFASLHRVGEAYQFRKQVSDLPLPEWLRLADTLRELSQVYELPLADFQRLNPELAAYPDQTLPAGTEVRVPDPDITPLLAARLAAAALDGPAPATNVRLIQKLVPIATPNPIALDTVLRRLVMAARPAPPVVQLLVNLVQQLVPPTVDNLQQPPIRS